MLCVVRVGTYDEAVALVNANRYGNGMAIFTHDGGAAAGTRMRSRSAWSG